MAKKRRFFSNCKDTAFFLAIVTTLSYICKKIVVVYVMRRFCFVSLLGLFAVLLVSCSTQRKVVVPSSSADYVPKREFRGAWMQVVNGQYVGMTSAEQQQRLLEQLDALQQAGVNAVVFQVRPEADALYVSFYEPWSRFLTGEQGRNPDADWDPLQFMIDACHARGMELHAWINPYRAALKGLRKGDMHHKHPWFRFPERFVEYDGLLLFNPALQLNRDYICTVVGDIVRRYDVDGLHIDDYFYPYPVKGVPFPDDADFAADPRGFTDKGDWRRDNVSLLVHQLSITIHGIKPWVKFGVSPFGIYHNGGGQEKGHIPGSVTSGLQNYDDLYADILLWIEKGWIDYTVPQLYWEIGHPRADYAALIGWWAQHASGRPLFIGQDYERSLQYADPQEPSRNQLAAKFRMQRSESVSGYCWWYADALRTHMVTPAGKAEVQTVAHAGTLALQPLFPFLDHKAPGPVRKPAKIDTDDGPVLMWTAPKYKTELDRPIRYVVYRFARGEKVDLSNPAHIVALTNHNYFNLTPQTMNQEYTYVITALDRLQNESRPTAIKVRL